jgi:hypothetical protein
MVTALTAADELGLPTTLRSEAEQVEAQSKAAAVFRVFMALCESLDAIYAAIVVEGDVPTPEDLGERSSSLGTEIFLSRRLLDVAPDLEEGVRAVFDDGDVVSVPGGLFVSGWADFNEQGRTIAAPLRASRQVASLIRSAVSRLTSESGELLESQGHPCTPDLGESP